MTNYLVNHCPNTVKHQASATQDKAGRQISYLLVRQTVVTRRLQANLHDAVIFLRTLVANGNGTEAILHIKSHCSAPIFLSCYFKVKLLTLKYKYKSFTDTQHAVFHRHTTCCL